MMEHFKREVATEEEPQAKTRQERKMEQSDHAGATKMENLVNLFEARNGKLESCQEKHSRSLRANLQRKAALLLSNRRKERKRERKRRP